MSSLPYFRWYPADAEIDENYAALNDTELGFCHRCLNRAWMNDGLPADLDRLASTMKVTRKYLGKVWPSVSKCFILTDTVIQRYVNPRQEKEREIALSKSRQSSEAVSIRELKRKGPLSVDTSTDTSTDDPRARVRAESGSESRSSVVEFQRKAVSQRTNWEAVNEAWKWYQQEYPSEVNTFIETQLFLSVMETDADLSDLTRNLPLWKQTRKWVEGFVPSSKNFLSERIFKIAPKEKDAPPPAKTDNVLLALQKSAERRKDLAR